jgi:hypothetical protein
MILPMIPPLFLGLAPDLPHRQPPERTLMSTRPLRLAFVTLAMILAGSIALLSAEHGLELVATAEASPTAAASPAAAPGSGSQARRPRKKRRPKADKTPKTEEPAEPAAEEPDAEAATPDAASGPAGATTSPTIGAGAASAGATGGGGALGAPGGASPSPAAPGTPAGTIVNTTSPEIASSAELVDVDALRQEYLQLRDELFRSRARASTLSSQLYTTKISIRFAFTSSRHYGVNKATIRLDGAAVYDDAEGAVGSDDAVRFEGYIAPGKHLLTFRIETTGKDDDRFTSAQEVQVALQAVADKDLVVIAKAKDGGDIAYQWKKGEKGSYGLGIDVSVKAQKRAEAKGK